MPKFRSKSGIKIIKASNFVKLYFYVDDRGNCSAKEYIEALQPKDRAKIIALFELMALKGNISNPEKFKALKGKDDLFEFKSKPHRFLCFILPHQTPKSFIITHGFKKEKGDTPTQEIKKAVEIKRKLLSLKDEDHLNIIED